MDKNNNQNKVDIKIITLGDSHVGKSSLIVKYIDNKFSNVYMSTIGFDLKHKQITLNDGTDAKIMIYDTAGQERFKSLAANYIKKANGILLVYDISEHSTFENIGMWMESITEEKGDKLPIVLVGNKADLTDERQVTYEEGKKLAEDKGFHFFETSCKDGANVSECFIDLAELVYEKSGKKLIQNSNKKLESGSSNKKKGCC
jgi:Ras-related protein Rab-1A